MTRNVKDSRCDLVRVRERVRRVRCVLLGVTTLAVMGLPSPAYAWWGWLEKMSGPDGLKGPQFDFRVVCFGEELPSEERRQQIASQTASAEKVIATARDYKTNSDSRAEQTWKQAAAEWKRVAYLWAESLGDSPPPDVKGTSEEQAEAWRVRALDEADRVPPLATAMTSAGVFWSFCGTKKVRRVALDVNLGLFNNDGSSDYAGGEPIHLTTLMTSVSWRLFGTTRWDFVEVSAGGGTYWFSSRGFPSKSGVVLQPGRVTFRAPSSWSAPRHDDRHEFWKRLAALPVYAIGFTMFPAGFEATDFAGAGERAVRIPRELLTTQYFFVNVEPLIRMPW